jgi:hypothetical protein
MRFDEALQHFSGESIDLLHIDGFHTYEAVREDFEKWYPKVKPGGLILLHDIYARLKDFGVWKFWEEISPRFESFGFKQGFGLGVVRKPGGPERSDPLLRWMFSGSLQEHSALRAFYVQMAYHLAFKGRFVRNSTREPPLPRRGAVPDARQDLLTVLGDELKRQAG